MPNNMEWTKGTIAMNQNMEWTTAMTRNHMEKTTATINPKIVVIVKCNNFNVNGLGINALPPALGAFATDETQAADEVGASYLRK